jgi:hypothetical protein
MSIRLVHHHHHVVVVKPTTTGGYNIFHGSIGGGSTCFFFSPFGATVQLNFFSVFSPHNSLDAYFVNVVSSIVRVGAFHFSEGYFCAWVDCGGPSLLSGW